MDVVRIGVTHLRPLVLDGSLDATCFCLFRARWAQMDVHTRLYATRVCERFGPSCTALEAFKSSRLVSGVDFGAFLRCVDRSARALRTNNE